jgi:hypothetical protein
MAKRDEPIGEIPCPLCKRAAEVVKFNDRTKLDPAGEGKPAYPRKVYIVCPPVTGYRGCGTILANSLEAQARIMETARIFGPAGAGEKPVAAPPPAGPQPPNKPAPPPAPAKKTTSFLPW